MPEPSTLTRCEAQPLDRSVPVELGGIACRIVCVDGVVPRHQGRPGQVRPRLQYVAGEVGHFELDKHRYAVVVDNPALPDGAAPDRPVDPEDMPSRLTNRELQIVQLICMGLLTKQVAGRLRLSEFTVRSYLKTIYCKLGVRSRGAMVYTYAQSMSRLRAVDGGS